MNEAYENVSGNQPTEVRDSSQQSTESPHGPGGSVHQGKSPLIRFLGLFTNKYIVFLIVLLFQVRSADAQEPTRAEMDAKLEELMAKYDVSRDGAFAVAYMLLTSITSLEIKVWVDYACVGIILVILMGYSIHLLCGAKKKLAGFITASNDENDSVLAREAKDTSVELEEHSKIGIQHRLNELTKQQLVEGLSDLGVTSELSNRSKSYVLEKTVVEICLFVGRVIRAQDAGLPFPNLDQLADSVFERSAYVYYNTVRLSKRDYKESMEMIQKQQQSLRLRAFVARPLWQRFFSTCMLWLKSIYCQFQEDVCLHPFFMLANILSVLTFLFIFLFTDEQP